MPMKPTVEMDRAWFDWTLTDEGFEAIESLVDEGFVWEYAGKDIPRDLDVGEHVLILDEFPAGDVLITKDLLDPKVAMEHGIAAMTTPTLHAMQKRRILEHFESSGAPVELVAPDVGEVALVHPATRAHIKLQGSKFDDTGPIGHVEGDTVEYIVERLIEDGYTEPSEGALDSLMGAQANPCRQSLLDAS